MKIILTLSTALLLFACSKNQDQLPENVYVFGQVVDSITGRGIPGVNIDVNKSKNFGVSDVLNTTTDSFGNFAFNFKPYLGFYYDMTFDKENYFNPYSNKNIDPVKGPFEFTIKLYKLK